MIERDQVALVVPPELVDALAGRVVELLEQRGLVGAPTAPEAWIGVDEAAAHLACPKSRVYDLVAERSLRVRRDGRRLLFRRSWLDEDLEQLDRRSGAAARSSAGRSAA